MPEDQDRIFEVAVWGDDDAPSHRALFTDETLAEAYRSKLPGGELDEVRIEAEIPVWVMAHRLEQFVTARDSVSFSGVHMGRTHTVDDLWSHELTPRRESWSHPDWHVEVQATNHPDLKLVKVLALSKEAAESGLEQEVHRLRQAHVGPRPEDVRMDVFTAGLSNKHARATHLPTGLVAEADGPGCEYAARSRLMVMVAAAAPKTATTLAAPAKPGDDAVALADPVPEGSWITVSARSERAERVPVLDCHGTGPYIASLGIPDPAAGGRLRRARLAHRHNAGEPIEVCDA